MFRKNSKIVGCDILTKSVISKYTNFVTVHFNTFGYLYLIERLSVSHDMLKFVYAIVHGWQCYKQLSA